MALERKDQARVLELFPLFRSSEGTRAFAAGGERLSFEAGRRILDERDPSRHMFALLEGLVGVFYSSAEGTEVMVKVFGGPALFGEMELPFGLPRMEYVEVIAPAEVIRWDGRAFLELLRKEPEACFQMFEDVSKRLCISAYLERALAFQDVEMRAAGLFLSFLDATDTTRTGGELPFKLSYGMIARCLGVTEKSVERTIGKWLAEGWIERKRGTYRITDLDALKGKADPDLLLLHARFGAKLR